MESTVTDNQEVGTKRSADAHANITDKEQKKYKSFIYDLKTRLSSMINEKRRIQKRSDDLDDIDTGIIKSTRNDIAKRNVEKREKVAELDKNIASNMIVLEESQFCFTMVQLQELEADDSIVVIGEAVFSHKPDALEVRKKIHSSMDERKNTDNIVCTVWEIEQLLEQYIEHLDDKEYLIGIFNNKCPINDFIAEKSDDN